MRATAGNLPRRPIRTTDVAHAPAYAVATYRELLHLSARLAYQNKDYMLFFRGQGEDIVNRAGASSYYPSLYRGDVLQRLEAERRFARLESASRQLKQLFIAGDIEGHQDVSRKRYVQWAVLQHYGTCPTPLIDFTQSLRVACSFAANDARSSQAYVSVFGMPYLTNRISMNSEQDTVLIRLLSICPPSALRPYYQEGYLAGTSDIAADYDPKSELDFNRRLIAKFAIPFDDAFWGEGLRGLSHHELYPADDSIEGVCRQIEPDRADERDTSPTLLGHFIAAWTGLERLILGTARETGERVATIADGTRAIREWGVLDTSAADELEQLRSLRSSVLHMGEVPPPQVLIEATERIGALREQIEHKTKRRGGSK